MKKNITFSLISINVVLALLLAWQWLSPAGQRDTHWSAPAAIKPQLTRDAGSQGRGGVSGTGLAALQERPIFSATRRPISAASAPVVARVDLLDSVRLHGVFAGSEGGGAILSSEGKSRRMKVNDALGDWRLQRIREREVVFARGSETRVISLVQAKQGQAAVAAGGLPMGALPFPMPAMAPPANIPPATTSAVPPPAAPAPTRPTASSAKPAPGFLIGGSR